MEKKILVWIPPYSFLVLLPLEIQLHIPFLQLSTTATAKAHLFQMTDFHLESCYAFDICNFPCTDFVRG